MSAVRVGVVGAGFMARAHAACYVRDPRVKLAVVATRSETSAAEFQKTFGKTEWFADWRDLVSNPGVDVVDITAPNALHAEMACAAIEAGKGVILEKPMAINLEEAARVRDAARGSGKPFMYAENRLFAPLFTAARERVLKGEVGTPMLLRINEMGSGPTHGKWFWDPAQSGGGALIDMGIHGIALAEWMTGSRIVRIHSVARSLKWKERSQREVEDTVLSTCEFDSGLLGQFVCSWAIAGGLDIRVELFGARGTILLDQSRDIGGTRLYRETAQSGEGDRPHQSSQAGWSYPPVDEWSVKGHRYELEHYIDCYLSGSEPLSGADTGYRALEVVTAAYRSIATGREVAL